MTPRDAAEVLGESFALAEGFTLHFVLSPAPDEARAFLGELTQRAPADDPRRLEIVDPYRAWSARATRPNDPLTIDDLERELTAGLARLDTLVVADVRALVLDASCAHPNDQAAWRSAFARSNEARNSVMRRLPTNVVLLLDAALGRDAILTAPDVWSVRTNQINLDGRRRELEPSDWFRQGADESVELFWAVTTLLSAAILPASAYANEYVQKPKHHSTLEPWIPESESEVIANPEIVTGLADMQRVPDEWHHEPAWRRAVRAAFGALPHACRTLDWSDVEHALAAFSAAGPTAAVHHAAYLLFAREAFAKGDFERAARWFTAAMPADPDGNRERPLLPRLGQCLSALALGQVEQARARFFELEAAAFAGESVAIEALIEARSAELYRLFGDARRAAFAAE